MLKSIERFRYFSAPPRMIHQNSEEEQSTKYIVSSIKTNFSLQKPYWSEIGLKDKTFPNLVLMINSKTLENRCQASMKIVKKYSTL